MKKLTFLLLMLPVCIGARAQAGATHGRWEENNSDRVHIAQDNAYANTEMNFDSRHITFTDLPDVKKGTTAIISSSTGEVLSQKKVDPAHNTMDVHWLSRGTLYYVTLVYRSENKKGFVLHF